MTDREVMQMALDALEEIESLDRHKWASFDKAKEALRAALAQGEQDTECPYCAGSGCVACDARCLPQGEQEPVAFFYLDADGEERFAHPEGYYPSYAKPLYSVPPQREWQGLTDEEVGLVSDEFLEGLLWAEAKLKEKNGY